MKQFKTVFNFEFLTLFKNKTLIISTIVLCLISFLGSSIPSIIKFFAKDSTPEEEVEGGEVIDETVFSTSGFVIDFEDNTIYLDSFEITEDKLYSDRQELSDAVDAGVIDQGFYLKSDTEFEMITVDSSPYSSIQFLVEGIMQEVKTSKNISELGLDPELVLGAIDVSIDGTTTVIGKDQGQGMFISMAILLVLYMLILLYGTNVSTSVAREKDSRTMELLITSTKPGTLILGKVLATGLMGILQVSAIFASLALGFFLSKGNYPESIIAMIQGTLGLETILVYILFSTSGYILYLFIYAAFGSLVSKVEDVNKAVMPITYVFLVAYFIASLAMQMPDLKLVAITSYIPFISIFTMPIRFMLTSVSWLSVLVSLIIMLISTGLLALLSIYIYRFGSLNYGNKIHWKQVLKSFKKD